MKNKKGLHKDVLKEHSEYLRSDEYKASVKQNILDQISEWLSHKYNCFVQVNMESGTFMIEGISEEDKPKLMEDLKEIGVL